jgi:hypothetical protein
MAFKPNYGRDRAERQRAARARSEEKQHKKDERHALRKVRRAAANLLRMTRRIDVRQNQRNCYPVEADASAGFP